MVPLDPILDISKSQQHLTAKWLVNVLESQHQHLVRYIVKDVVNLVYVVEDRMKDKTILSLPTNIPLTETINYICGQIQVTNSRK